MIELHAMMQAFRDYRITGGVPVLRQVESLYYHQTVDSEFKAFLTDHEVGKRVLQALQAAAAIITIALHMPELSHKVTLLLSGPT
ncbi:MAG TPA: hypothetical protein VNU48_02640 [Burkholderiaceae bacterium]|nr:hypothetical protein [Burkholderiaceae bacterium]